MSDGKMIAKEVVDAMLEEVQTSMQNQISGLLQRNATLRGTMKQLEMHGTGLEAKVAEQATEIDRLKVLAGEADPTPPVLNGLEEREI